MWWNTSRVIKGFSRNMKKVPSWIIQKYMRDYRRAGWFYERIAYYNRKEDEHLIFIKLMNWNLLSEEWKPTTLCQWLNLIQKSMKFSKKL